MSGYQSRLRLDSGDVMSQFTAIIPVKQFIRSKTRLSDDPLLRASLAKAFARDVVLATRRSCMIESIVLVTSEDGEQLLGRDHGSVVAEGDIHVVADVPWSTNDALNDALCRGAAWSGRYRPDNPVVVIPADLAAITAGALDEALAIATTVKTAYVVDAEGTGTTLSTALDAHDLRSLYGPNSATHHHVVGYSPLARVDARLRQDVDTLADLQRAVTLGVGRNTQAAVRSFGLESEPQAPLRTS